MTSSPDLLDLINAEIDALEATNFSPVFPEIPETREAQVIDKPDVPGFPVFPVEIAERLETRNSSDDREVDTRARIESARAKASVEEETGKTGNPYETRDVAGKNPGKLGKTGNSLLKEEEEDLIVEFEERAAIREYEGGFPRPQAEALAIEDCLRSHAGEISDSELRSIIGARL